MRQRWWVGVWFVVLALWLGGCGSPTLEVTVEGNTEVAPAAPLSLKIHVGAFRLAKDKIGQAPQPGEGHYRIYLDNNTDANYLVADALPQLQLTIPANTTPGFHTLRVALVQNNGAPLEPKQESILSISVKANSNGASAVTLLVNSTTVIAGNSLMATIQVTHFTLVPLGSHSVNKPNEGHYHITLDDNEPSKKYLSANVKEKIEITIPANTPPGKHTLNVYLMHNDHTKYEPEIKDTVEITVTSKGQENLCLDAYKTQTQCATFEDRTAAAAERIVSFTCCAYTPKCLQIKTGQAVVFKGDFTAHPLSQVCGPTAAISRVDAGDSSSFTFNQPGLYGYYCDLHGQKDGSGMAGMIEVIP